MEDYNIDEDDVRERVYFNSVFKSYILSLLLMEAIYFLVHVLASALFREFHVLNPICLLFALELGWLAFKRFSSRFLQQELKKILMTIAVIAVVLEFVISSEDAPGFTIRLFHMAFGSFAVTAGLFSVLALIFM